MGARSKRSASSADVWLVDGVPKANPEASEGAANGRARSESAPENVEPETQQWLAIPPPPTEPAATERRRASERGKPDVRSEKDLSAELHAAQRLVEEQRSKIQMLQGQVSELEAELGKVKKAAGKPSAGPARGPRSGTGAAAELDETRSSS